MIQVIDLGNELLVDRSQVRNGELRLLLTAVGHPLVSGSPWTVIDKRLTNGYKPLFDIVRQGRRQMPAA
jgi:hypothetical protein